MTVTCSQRRNSLGERKPSIGTGSPVFRSRILSTAFRRKRIESLQFNKRTRRIRAVSWAALTIALAFVSLVSTAAAQSVLTYHGRAGGSATFTMRGLSWERVGTIRLDVGIDQLCVGM